MGIPESQLETWCNRPDPASSAATYAVIKRTLDNSRYLAGKRFEVYLQGSYRNATNIRADSDVDVVVELTSTFNSNTLALSAGDRALYKMAYSDATYTWSDFRRDVTMALKAEFGWSAVDTTGNKSIKLAAAPGRLKADVVPALQHRLYTSFSPERYLPGIAFWTQLENREVINYPKLHIANGETKNGANGHYKAGVRMMKNARRVACERGYLSRDVSPSYFVECFFYNAPDSSFGSNRVNMFFSLLEWGFGGLEGPKHKCCNGLQDLFGPTPEQWDIVNAPPVRRGQGPR